MGFGYLQSACHSSRKLMNRGIEKSEYTSFAVGLNPRLLKQFIKLLYEQTLPQNTALNARY